MGNTPLNQPMKLNSSEEKRGLKAKVQNYLWLLLQNRKWTARRLRARGLPHDDRCCLCNQQLETAQNLALQCPYARGVGKIP
jgi:hypothetical protein